PLAAPAVVGRAVAPERATVRIGVLTALTGPYADAAGYGSVVATRMAVEDFTASTRPPFKIEVVAGDMLDKPDIGLTVARSWYDQNGVDMVVDVPNSAVALAVAALTRDKNKV